MEGGGDTKSWSEWWVVQNEIRVLHVTVGFDIIFQLGKAGHPRQQPNADLLQPRPCDYGAMFHVLVCLQFVVLLVVGMEPCSLTKAKIKRTS